MTLMDVNKLIECFIERYKNEASKKEESRYVKYIEKFREDVVLRKVTKKDVEEYVRPFLYKWGKMGRVLGRIPSWEAKLADKIRENSQILESFRKKDLFEADIDDEKIKSDIKKCYRSFEGVIKQTAAAKTLNLICPKFFPAWDSNIIWAFKKEIDSNRRNKPYEDIYYMFMKKIKKLFEEYEDIFTKYTECNKSKLKIVDECLWWATNRPLSLLLI
ncbi:hypothetical protein [Candidatus Pyrohabitans sp.]